MSATEEDLIVWQEVFDRLMMGRKEPIRCPFCSKAELLIDREQSHVKVKCPNKDCSKFIEGSLGPDYDET